MEDTGEDQLKVKWREEEHKSDDDMDCQQVGLDTPVDRCTRIGLWSVAVWAVVRFMGVCFVDV